MTPAPATRVSRIVPRFLYGADSFGQLGELLRGLRRNGRRAVFCVDSYFRGKPLVRRLPRERGDLLLWIDASSEPSTERIDSLAAAARRLPFKTGAVVGVGGGSALDSAKAVSNLLTNAGRAADYQGWDLLKRPGVFKVGVPTLSGTGAETSRTCVMINPATGVKLGMNSEHTVFDALVLDPSLSATAPRRQYFFTGMDTYVHCIESLAGRYRHAVADALSRQALALCREVFLGVDMMSAENRERLMVASYLGGSAIANSYVGVVHPFSAGLSVVLGIHHGEANCIAMTAMAGFYPRETAEFLRMARRQGVRLRKGLCRGLSDADHRRLYESTVVHEKPLRNALGDGFRRILTPARVRRVFLAM